jgi:glycosyltransferase involved in cell wall biosynthesis
VSQTGGGRGVAVLIPCRDEEATVAQVVKDVKRALPEARVYVYDNCSRDRTAEVAAAAGATVGREPRPGKSQVIKRMFADVEADVYIVVDGDATYGVEVLPQMAALVLEEGYDLVNAARDPEDPAAFRRGHRLGNRFLSWVMRVLFRAPIRDALSGLKAFSRGFVKSFPVLSAGFSIEVEMLVHALSLGMPVTEVTGSYRARTSQSESKLRTFRDGARILATALNLFRQESPLAFFFVIGLLLLVASVALGVPIVLEFFHTHQVPRLPTAVLATGIAILGFLSLTVGLVLDTVSRGRKEVRLLAYLQARRPNPGQLGQP